MGSRNGADSGAVSLTATIASRTTGLEFAGEHWRGAGTGGHSGSAASRGRSGRTNSRGRSGRANSRGRSGRANSLGQSGSTELDEPAGTTESWTGPAKKQERACEERPQEGAVLEQAPGAAREALSWTEPAEMTVSWAGPAETKTSWMVPVEMKVSWMGPAETKISWAGLDSGPETSQTPVDAFSPTQS